MKLTLQLHHKVGMLLSQTHAPRNRWKLNSYVKYLNFEVGLAHPWYKVERKRKQYCNNVFRSKTCSKSARDELITN